MTDYDKLVDTLAKALVAELRKQPSLAGLPSPELVARAKAEIQAEDEAERAATLAISSNPDLPSEHPDHICGALCDGQDGSSSHCARLRRKLFGRG